MPVNLQKGQKVSLTKGNPGLKNILVGLGWDTNKYDGGFDFDLDAAVFLLGEDGKVPTSDEFVFYGNRVHKSGAVEHLGDNLTGVGDGDDEQITVDLSKVPSNVQRIAFTDHFALHRGLYDLCDTLLVLAYARLLLCLEFINACLRLYVDDCLRDS